MYMSPCKDRSRSVLLSSRIVSEAAVAINHTPAFQSEACRFTGGCDLYLSPFSTQVFQRRRRRKILTKKSLFHLHAPLKNFCSVCINCVQLSTSLRPLPDDTRKQRIKIFSSEIFRQRGGEIREWKYYYYFWIFIQDKSFSYLHSIYNKIQRKNCYPRLSCKNLRL